MQHTTLTDSNSTGGTGDRRNLPRRQFTLLHCNRVRRLPPRECSILDTSGRGWLTFQKFCIFTRRAKISLVVQDNTEEGFIDADLALVFDKPQLPKFVHEKINS